MLPGIFVTALLTVLAIGIENLPFWPFTIEGPAPHPIDRMIVAIVLGMGLRSFFSLSDRFHPGVQYTAKSLLPVGIMLIGARLDFSVLLTISGAAFVINLVCVVFAYVLTLYLCRWLLIPERTSILLGIGTAICGATAIVAAAPVIRARGSEISISVSTITLFGILAIVAYPVLGHAFGMDEIQFGMWAGTAIQAVPQVIAAGFAYGERAGEVALLVKLVRILFLVPWILYLSYQYREESAESPSALRLVPPFVYGFLFFSLLASLGWIPLELQPVLRFASSFLITMAMAAVGLETDLRGALHSNAKALLAGFVAALILGVSSYVLIVSFV